MSYTALYRKFRPDTFADVKGQEAIVTTLKNQIKANRIGHAYLFCGTRGTGKTTVAKILAKTVNCEHPVEGNPCNKCKMCLAIGEQASMNVIEIDAASNNGVDNIREIREEVEYRPTQGNYKVYIIDEVHMLSTQAFNAFLKTLEEPPHHALFILATTEKHKIIPTILSRCQIYDFSRIGINDIVDNLEYIAQSEKVNFEKEALNAIAQKADGGMRDALSIFDQVVSFSAGNVTYKSVIENLNVLDYEYYFQLTDAILAKNVSQSFLTLDEIMGKGFDGQQILTGLANFFRDVLVCRDSQTIVLFEVGDAVKEKYIELAQRCTNEFLYKAIELSNECDLNYRYSKNKRLLIELLLIRLCQFDHQSAPIDDKKKIKINPLVPQQEAQGNVGSPKEVVAKTQEQPVETNVSANASTPDASNVKLISRNKLSFSLKGTNTEKKEEIQLKTEVAKNVILNESFTQEDLEKCWKKYAEKEEDVHLKNTILNIVPEQREQNLVQIAVFNPDQQRKLEDKSAEIKAFLFQELKNTQLQLNIVVTEDKEQFIPYNSRDKFEFMAEKNQALLSLAKEFNLILD